MKIQTGKKYLITCDNWFYAPDGCQYNAAYGTVKNILSDEDSLGIKTNRGSTNWYVEVGNMFIAGCQIHYVVNTDMCNLSDASQFHTDNGEVKKSYRPTCIYDADQYDGM